MFKFLNLQRTIYTKLKKLFTYLLIVFLFAFAGCQNSVTVVPGPSSIPVDSTYTNESTTTELIAPYKEQLDKEMNEVLVISAEEFPKEKGKPETKLGNLVADLSFEVASEMYPGQIDFCILNFGGLRTSLPKGEITRGKVFELMPFENELVVLTLHKDSLFSLTGYLVSNGGQPVSNFKLLHDEYGDTEFSLGNEIKHTKDYYKVLSTDYLANGGDNMTFFANPIKSERVGIKLRDAILQHFKALHAEGKQLESKLDGRISFE